MSIRFCETQIAAKCFISSPLVIVGLALNDGLPHFRQFDFQMPVAVTDAPPSVPGSAYCISNANRVHRPSEVLAEAAPAHTSHARRNRAIPFCTNEALELTLSATNHLVNGVNQLVSEPRLG